MTTIDSPGVYTDFVVFNQWVSKDRVSENNWFAEIVGGTDKFISYPETPVRYLLAEMFFGLQAGVDVDAMPVLVVESKIFKKGNMACGKHCTNIIAIIRIYIITFKGLQAADF